MSRISDPVLAHIMAYETFPELPADLIGGAFRLTLHILACHRLETVGLMGEIGRASDGRYALYAGTDWEQDTDWFLAFAWDLDANRAYHVGLVTS